MRVITELTEKLSSGATITAADIEQLHKHVSMFPRPEAMALYGAAKARYQIQQTQTDTDDEYTPKDLVTASELEEARLAAKANPSAGNLVRYSTLKRMMEQQGDGE